MSKYILTFNGEIEIEADSIEAASQKAHVWRRFILHEVVQVNYSNLGVRRMSIKPMLDVVEVTPEYLLSHPPRMVIKRETSDNDINPPPGNDTQGS